LLGRSAFTGGPGASPKKIPGGDMATSKNKETKKPAKPRVSKLNVWFKFYTDDSNPLTYLNKTESARAAGYSQKNLNVLKSIGCQNFTKLNIRINQWLDEVGLSEACLKNKLASLLEARQVNLIKIKGEVEPGSLPPGAMVVAKSSVKAWKGRGEDVEPVDDGDTVVAIPVEALETQRRSLDMAFKVKALYAPEKIDVVDTRMVQALLNSLPPAVQAQVKAQIKAITAPKVKK